MTKAPPCRRQGRGVGGEEGGVGREEWEGVGGGGGFWDACCGVGGAGQGPWETRSSSESERGDGGF